MKRVLLVFALAAVGEPCPGLGQALPESPPTTILVRPAAEPTPALTYRLVPERRALAPGNAAIFYHRAIQLEIEQRPRADSKVKSADQIGEWAACPIAEIPRDQAHQVLEPFQNALREVELGATRLDCDWEFDRRHEGVNLLLPEIQRSRTLARLVGLRARLAILDGQTDEAIHWIETGLVLGRHVSQGPIVIQALVGIAIDFTMVRNLQDLIQAPGAPNLYWALADRPRPFVDMRYAMEGERDVLEKELPELNDLDRGPWSVDEARLFVAAIDRRLFRLVSGEPLPGGGAVPRETPEFGRRLGIAAMAAKIYPDAKRALVARGRPAPEVEAMPVVQVAALHCFHEYQRVRDESYKWLGVPYWQSYDRLDRALQAAIAHKWANPLLTLFAMVTPALNSARLASIRLERQLDALQCVEAIRLYAAAHGGKLPESLDAMTDAPAPMDPATGKPFSYTSDGHIALLRAAVPPGAPQHPSYSIRYALKLAH
jgi:hypothetical protein